MGYIGRGPVKSGAFRIIDDVSSSFNGSTTAFTLQSSSSNITPGTEQNLLIAVDGVVQEPQSAFTISGSTLTFTSAPASGASFWGIELGDVGGIAANVANGAVDTAQLAADAVDGTKLADDAIDSEHYTNASIDTAHIGNLQITNALLADDAVGADELAANAVVNASIASGAAINFSKMENLTASRLLVSDGSGDVSVSSVTTTNLTDLTDSGATTLHSHAAGGLRGSMFLSNGHPNGTGATFGAHGRGAAILFAHSSADQEVYYSGSFPSDMTTLEKAVMVCYTTGASGNLYAYFYAYTGAQAGEIWNTNSDTDTSQVIPMTQNIMKELNMASVFTNIAGGDHFQVQLYRNGNSSNDTIEDLKIYGLLFEWT